MTSLSFSKIRKGQKKFFKTVISTNDIDAFSKISGDTNIIHLEKKAAIKKKFKNRVVHGAYILSLFSKLVGTKLPGNNALVLFMDVKFKNPAYPNEIIKIEGKVKEKHRSVNSIVLDIHAKYSDGKIIANGNVTVKIL
jgi:acyl dehydratase|tara:strand:- start:213 stop:626 length:414 start_codon:yes stop_codon:yes gene_type:complete